MNGYFAWAVAHPRLLILLCILVIAAFASGLRFVSFNPDSRVFFGAQNPQRLALERLERVYSSPNNVVVVVAPRDANVFSVKVLALIEQLTEQFWKTPYATRVDSLANSLHSFARDDELVIEPLYKRAAGLGERDLDRIKRLALGNRELVNRLVSAKGDVTAVRILVVRPGKSPKEVAEIAGYVERLVEEARKTHPHVEFHLTGGIMADAAFAQAGRRDSLYLGPLMIVLIVAMLWVAFRSVVASFATIMVVIAAVVVALGLFVGLGASLNGATAGAPVIIMTICILDAAHVIATMGRLMRGGIDKNSAIVESLRLNNTAMFITSLTDVIGFLVLNFAESPPLVELGNMVTVGAVAGYLFSISLLPALLVLLPAPPSREPLRLDRKMRRLADFVISYRRSLLLGMSVLGVVLISGFYRISLDDDFVKYFDERFAFRRATDFMQERLSGLNVISFSLPANEEHGITRPDYLKNLDRFAEWFRRQDHVAHVITIADVIKRLHKNLNGDDPAYERIADSRALNAQLLLLYEMSVPPGLDLRSQVDVSKSSTMLTVILRNVSSAEVQRLGRIGENWLRQNAPAMATQATGLSIAYAHVSETNIRTMLLGTFVGLSLISLTMFAALRDWRLGLLSLIPNVIPAAMAYGLWGYVFGEVNLVVSVVGSFTFGIIVDDTVHFVTKYHYARRELRVPAEEAIRYSFSMAGLPMLLASVVLFVGFAVQCFSGFAVTRQMGMLSATTILLGVIVELVLLPALLLLFARRVGNAKA